MTLFELKEKIATLNAAIEADAAWIAEKAADPAVAMADITAKKAHRDELVTRRDMLQAQHDELEAAQKAKVKEVAGMSEEDQTIKAKSAFYRAALTGGDVKKAYAGLGAIPTGSENLGGGENLLPTKTW